MNNNSETMGRMFKICSNDEIGKNIRRIRRTQKISQKDLAILLGKSERTIQKYEAGEIELNISTLQQIADELNVPWYELTYNEEDNVRMVAAKKETNNRYDFHTLSDIFNALFSMTEIPELQFGLSCTKPPEDSEWTSSLFINGKGNGKYNSDFCLFIENWLDKVNMLQSGKISHEQYVKWQKKTLDYYSESYFSDTASRNLQAALDEKLSGLSEKHDNRKKSVKEIILKPQNMNGTD